MNGYESQCYSNSYLTKSWVQWYLVRIYNQEKKRQEGIAHLGKNGNQLIISLAKKNLRVEKHTGQQVCILIRLTGIEYSCN